MARDPAKYVLDRSQKGVWDRELPSIRLDDLTDLFDTAQWMHRMHEVICETRWPGAIPNIMTPNANESAFVNEFKALTGFYPKDKSHFKRRRIVEETPDGRVVRPIYQNPPEGNGMYERFVPDKSPPEFGTEWVNLGKSARGRGPRLTSIEDPADEAIRKATNDQIKLENAFRREQGVPEKELLKPDGIPLMGAFLDWCLWYAREWYREKFDESAELVVSPKHNKAERLDNFSECARLGLHMAKICDPEYHAEHCWTRLNVAKDKHRYYDI